MKQNISYPQYRKYPNNKAFFKIISTDEWEEIQILGKKHNLHHFKAKILPDRNFITDLTFDYHNHWQVIDMEEYENAKKKITKP